MPCDTQRIQEAQRREREAAFAELQKQLQQGKIILEKVGNRVTIRNWGATRASQSGLHESCVLARIAKSGSWLAKQKLEALLKPLGVTPKQVIGAHDDDHRH